MINHPPPWVRSGAEINEGELTSSWAARAGLGFTVEKKNVYYFGEGQFNPVDNAGALVRSDNGDVLSIVSQNRYKIVQPMDIIGMYLDISKTNDLKLEAGGALKGGRNVWALASTGKKFEVKGDPLTEYILFSTGFDGVATKGCLVTRRDSCWNTLEIAQNRGASKISITHAQVFDSKTVQLNLNFSPVASSEYIAELNRLAKTRVNDQDARWFFKGVYFPNVEVQNLTDRQNARLDNLMFIYAGGLESQQRDIHGSLWGVVNAVTFEQDHVSTARSDDNRMTSAWFGKGRTTKLAAYDTAVSMLN